MPAPIRVCVYFNGRAVSPWGFHCPLRTGVQGTAYSILYSHGKVTGLFNKISVQGLQPGGCSVQVGPWAPTPEGDSTLGLTCSFFPLSPGIDHQVAGTKENTCDLLLCLSPLKGGLGVGGRSSGASHLRGCPSRTPSQTADLDAPGAITEGPMDFSSGLPQGPLRGIPATLLGRRHGLFCCLFCPVFSVCGFASFFFSTETAAMPSFCPVASAQVFQVLQQVQFC